MYKQVCVLSSDSGDSKLGSTLHSAVSSLLILTSVRAVFRLRRFKPRIYPTFSSLQVFSRVRVTVRLPHPLLFEATGPGYIYGRSCC
ncbi:hypothetical protein J6590_083170 [Homalodisca vitripennis]|nr:hypothetical protein J6590_083170 [Homalodisca vitripennis]